MYLALMSGLNKLSKVRDKIFFRLKVSRSPHFNACLNNAALMNNFKYKLYPIKQLQNKHMYAQMITVV